MVQRAATPTCSSVPDSASVTSISHAVLSEQDSNSLHVSVAILLLSLQYIQSCLTLFVCWTACYLTRLSVANSKRLRCYTQQTGDFVVETFMATRTVVLPERNAGWIYILKFVKCWLFIVYSLVTTKRHIGISEDTKHLCVYTRAMASESESE
jgi:hypothetical protein